MSEIKEHLPQPADLGGVQHDHGCAAFRVNEVTGYFDGAPCDCGAHYRWMDLASKRLRELASDNAALRERIGDSSRWPEGTSASSYMNYLTAEYEALKADFEKEKSRVAAAEEECGRLRKVMEEICKKSPPNDWKFYVPIDGYCGYGDRGDADFVDCVDESNSGDVHSHGWSCGRWSVVKELRAALAALRKEGSGR